jgi:hypothetical protein
MSNNNEIYMTYAIDSMSGHSVYWSVVDDLKNLGIRAVVNVVKKIGDHNYTITFESRDDLNLFLISGKVERYGSYVGSPLYRYIGIKI